MSSLLPFQTPVRHTRVRPARAADTRHHQTPALRRTSKGDPMTETSLTKRQQDILVFIERTVSERGYPPSVREIGEAVGL
ncbi:MAG: hypothetical protein ACKO04_00055, partial [Actinomycetes bacterium]